MAALGRFGLPVGAVAVIGLLAVLAAVGWSNVLHQQRLVGWHLGIIEGTVPAPDEYRVLPPRIAEALSC